MRLRKVKNALDIVESSNYVIKNPEELKGKFKSLFNNDNPIHLEIGMGKGDFVIGMAKKYPDINFIGLEKFESVQVRAVQKLEEEDIPNLRLLHMDACDVDKVFDHEIETLYLNFSDPWPKARHAKRRLTSDYFLKIYDSIFIGEPHIIQKTDNIGLFASSIESLTQYGYEITKCSLDLHSEDMDNVETEYEQKFSAKGQRINYLNAVKHK
jgi:tRNA (guanine-N7-)-methyltransferase